MSGCATTKKQQLHVCRWNVTSRCPGVQPPRSSSYMYVAGLSRLDVRVRNHKEAAVTCMSLDCHAWMSGCATTKKQQLHVCRWNVTPGCPGAQQPKSSSYIYVAGLSRLDVRVRNHQKQQLHVCRWIVTSRCPGAQPPRSSSYMYVAGLSRLDVRVRNHQKQQLHVCRWIVTSRCPGAQPPRSSSYMYVARLSRLDVRVRNHQKQQLHVCR